MVDQDGRVLVGRVEGFDGFFQSGAEGFGDGFVDNDAFGRHADLACVQESAGSAGVGGFFEVGVCEDDGGGFAAEFHEDGFEVFAGLFGDDAAGGGGAGEVNFFDRGVGDECCCD